MCVVLYAIIVITYANAHFSSKIEWIFGWMETKLLLQLVMAIGAQ
jgi:hypothetical protein